MKLRNLPILALILFSCLSHLQANYHPDLGRFISLDPIREEGGLNLYGYVQNDPINKFDLLGLITRLSTASEFNNVLIMGYQGRGGTSDTQEGVYKSLQYIGQGEYDIYSMAWNDDDLAVYDRIHEHSLKNCGKRFNLIVVGHSFGGHSAIKTAEFYRDYLPSQGIKARVFLISIDAIKNDAGPLTIQAINSGPTGMAFFANIYQTQDTNSAGVAAVRGSSIPQASFNWNVSDHHDLGNGAHTEIDNFLINITGGWMKAWADFYKTR